MANSIFYNIEVFDKEKNINTYKKLKAQVAQIKENIRILDVLIDHKKSKVLERTKYNVRCIKLVDRDGKEHIFRSKSQAGEYMKCSPSAIYQAIEMNRKCKGFIVTYIE